MSFIYGVLARIVTLFYIIIFLRVLSSWIPMARESKFGQVIYNITEPILAPVRELINKLLRGRTMMIDLSALVVILTLMFIRNILIILS